MNIMFSVHISVDFCVCKCSFPSNLNGKFVPLHNLALIMKIHGRSSGIDQHIIDISTSNE
jgi:hypothetical protein